ncbi:MAG TPA: dienelactone hydrolase family protein [Bacteroidales bacterium]|nr:dienelactone hydrolase family protein [Bacteroidales bacterium]
MEPQINDLYLDYKRGATTRRDFLRKLTLYAGSTAAATSIFATLNAGDAGNDVLLTDDETGLFTESVTYPGKTGEIKAFLARPEKKKKYPAVMIIHENRGLQPHIKDVARRMAKEGFLALAPDALTPLGGTPDNDPDKARDMIGQLNQEDTVNNLVAAVKYLETHPQSNTNVGCTGFCWGGAMTNQVAVHSPDLKAAVPYYGRQPAVEDVPKIKAPILAHYAGDDPGINAGIAAFEEALKKAGHEYKIFIYDGAKHAFNNDSNPERYNKQAADLAWTRTVAFFKEKLEG